jgi:hypothetical protein
MTGVACLEVMRLNVNINMNGDTVLVEHSRFGGGVVVERPSRRARFLARWHPWRLDEALAAGTPPEAGAALALRARRLTEPAERRSIADALRRVLREARERPRGSTARIVPSRKRVAAAARELSRLADVLSNPGPVSARGVAEAHLLLTDGTGPLYNPCRGSSLAASAARAAEHLQPWPA